MTDGTNSPPPLPLDDPRDAFLARVVPGRTFADVGGLWGVVNERVSVAARLGARPAALATVRLALLLCLAAGLACADGERREDAGSGVASGEHDPRKPEVRFSANELPRTSSVIFGASSPDPEWRESQDRLRLSTVAFKKLFRAPISFVPEPRMVLRFLPIIEVPDHRCEVETWLTTEGGEEFLLDVTETAYATSPHLVGTGRFAALQQSRRISLARFAGRRSSLEWRVRHAKGQPPHSVHLAQLAAFEPVMGKPDILLVCSDTHRYDYSLEGRGRDLMPALQALATQSTLFTRAFSQASWTLPSIASVLTGLPPRYHRTGRLIDVEPETSDSPRRPLKGQFLIGWGGKNYYFQAYPRSLASLPERLSGAGYETFLVSASYFYGASGLSRDGFETTYEGGVVPGHFLNAAVREVTGSTRERPVFILVHYMDVHHYQMWFDAREREASKDPAWQTQLYAERVADMDRTLAELVETWSARPDADSTMIAFFSDHGEHLAEEGFRAGGHGNTMSDSLLHVPLLVRFPNRPDLAGITVNREVGLMDLYQTALEVAGVPVDADADTGVSLLASAAGQVGRHRDLFADYQLDGSNLASVRRGPFKLVLDLDNGQESFEGPPPEDGLVARNRDAKIIRELRDRYRAYMARAEGTAGELTSDHEVDQTELERQLRAMGYLR